MRFRTAALGLLFASGASLAAAQQLSSTTSEFSPDKVAPSAVPAPPAGADAGSPVQAPYVVPTEVRDLMAQQAQAQAAAQPQPEAPTVPPPQMNAPANN
jgi:hypothetical protein